MHQRGDLLAELGVAGGVGGSGESGVDFLNTAVAADKEAGGPRVEVVDAGDDLVEVVAVAGDGPLAASLRAQAPQVRWLGRRDDVADLYAAADVVVLPSVWEARSRLPKPRSGILRMRWCPVPCRCQ